MILSKLHNASLSSPSCHKTQKSSPIFSKTDKFKLDSLITVYLACSPSRLLHIILQSIQQRIWVTILELQIKWENPIRTRTHELQDLRYSGKHFHSVPTPHLDRNIINKIKKERVLEAMQGAWQAKREMRASVPPRDRCGILTTRLTVSPTE